MNPDIINLGQLVSGLLAIQFGNVALIISPDNDSANNYVFGSGDGARLLQALKVWNETQRMENAKRN